MPAKRLDARSSPLGEGTKPRFDRTTYQREYMRKKRAKAKEAGK